MVAKGGHGRPRPVVAAVGGRLRGATGALPAPAGERERGGAGGPGFPHSLRRHWESGHVYLECPRQIDPRCAEVNKMEGRHVRVRARNGEGPSLPT